MTGSTRGVFTLRITLQLAAATTLLCVGCSTDRGRPDGPGARYYGSTGYYEPGSTGDGGSSTTGYYEPGSTGFEGSSSTGEYCIVEEPEECCIEACAPDAGQPVPGDETNFDCPVAGMEYNCGCDGTDLFDCDDFAYACENWGSNQGYNICTYVFYWDDAMGDGHGHAINIVEFEYDGPNAKYCFIEPQSNTSYGCWIQAEGEPNPPDWAKDDLCDAWGGTCTGDDITCDGDHHPNAGEVCFNTLPAVCSRFRMETGLCPYTFEPDHDCHDTDATGDDCYWSCADDEVCGASCFQCDPVPQSGTTGGDAGSTGGFVEYCADINGNNESCYWECDDGQTCGSGCYSCV